MKMTTDCRVETLREAAELARGLMLAYGDSPAMPHGVIQGGILGPYLRIGDYYVVETGYREWSVQWADPMQVGWQSAEELETFDDAGRAVLEAFAMAHEDWLERTAARLLERGEGP
jgi:hypothetical protein